MGRVRFCNLAFLLQNNSVMNKKLFNTECPRAARSGFSLLELAIVLVVIGLLIGGALTGKSLLRAAELRPNFRTKFKGFYS